MKAYREGRARGLDGVPLHFTSYGEGEPTLVCLNGVGVSTFFWKYIVRYFSGHHRVVTWDYRGHGRSGDPPKVTRDKFTVAASVQDLVAVMDEAGVEKAVLLGHSMGTQVALEMWRRHPERVSGLVLVCGAFGRPLDTFWNSRLSAPVFDLVYSVVNLVPKTWATGNARLMRSRLPMTVAYMGVVDRHLARREDMKPYFDHLARVDPQIFFLMTGEMQRHTSIKWLDKVDVPVLIMAGENDYFTPHHLSVQMRDRIPKSELLTIPQGSHAALIEQPELVNLRLEKFLRDRVMTEGEAALDAARESRSARRKYEDAPGNVTAERKRAAGKKAAGKRKAPAKKKARRPKLRVVGSGE